MDESKKQELEELLKESLSCLTIESRYIRNLTPQVYKHLFHSTLYRERQRMLKWSCSLNIKDDNVKASLLRFLQVELADYMNNDRILTYAFGIWGGSGSGDDLGSIIQSLCRISIVWNTRKAVDTLERYINDNFVSLKRVAILDGVKIENEIQLNDGIKLVPLPNSAEAMPSIVPLDSAIDNAFDFLSKTLLIMDYTVRPVFSKPLRNIEEKPFKRVLKSTDLGDTWIVENVCMMLSLTCNNAVRSFSAWWHVEEDELCVYENSVTSTPSGRGFNSVVPVPISEKEVNRSLDLYKSFIRLSDGDRKQIVRISDRWLASKTYKHRVDQMIDLGIAFELIYLGGNNKEQLSFTFRIRAAWYLGESVADRKRLISIFRKIYDCRSQAVHNGKLDNNVQIDGCEIPIGEFVTEAQNLCLQSIIKIIENGKLPRNEWDDLIVGDHATQRLPTTRT